MMRDGESLEDGAEVRSDVTVVGAGAAGIVLALELAKAGRRVCLVESGTRVYSPRIQALADAAQFDPAVQAPMSECTRRQVGGTSVIWGGRVVPFDPVDFDERPWMPHSNWPLRYEEVLPYFGRACAYLRCGEPAFDAGQLQTVKHASIVPGLPNGDVLSTSLERWSVMDFGKVYAREIDRSELITLLHGVTCTEIEPAPAGGRVACIRASTMNGRHVRLVSQQHVLACGGLNATRLLLASDRVHRGGIGNHSGMLGRFYQGHISGRIADVQFTTPPRATAYGFERDEHGVYARRRFTFSRAFMHEQKLSNIAAWLVNPDIWDPSHGNGVLSFAQLILSSPMGRFLASEAIRKAATGGDAESSTWLHVKNMIKDLPRTAWFIPTFGYKRFLAKRKVPGFFQYSRSNVYPLHYFGEQVANPESRVTLSDERDELGMRRINIDLRYGEADVDHVVRAHELWDRHLRAHDCGRLEYVTSDLRASIREQAGDGFHQVGTTRMSVRPDDGVVTPACNIHGFDDLFVASSSTFVTASQANSMFMILVLALRIADRLATMK